MGTKVGIEGSEKEGFQECWDRKSVSCLSSTEQIPDPVVYKLVRVEIDGRLVPATDEEVMEVEELLMDDKNENHILKDTGKDAECTSKRESSSGMLPLKDPEGLPQSEDTRARPDKLNSQLEENDAPLVPSLSDDQNKECSVWEYSHLSDKTVEGDASTSAPVTASKPDFSKIKGEICLDNLSIRELQETFRATFGRETNVTDKLWLKRRIAMGLTNSCDVSTTSFTIKDNKLVRKDNEETCNNMGVTSAEDGATTTDLRKKSSNTHTGHQQDKRLVSDKKLDSINGMFESEDSLAEQRAAKRARKPTRRYIEEPSEVESRESNARFTASSDHSKVGYVVGKSNFKSVGSVSSENNRPVITRLDSLGIQVPCVSRIRRSRPRTNYTALLTVNPSWVEKAVGLVKAHSHDVQSSNECRDNTFRAISTTLVQDQAVSHSAEDKQLLIVQKVGLGPHQELRHVNSFVNPVHRVASVPKASGCMRRKHQRAWTLSEVVKLVDGVSRYGAGRWSEIKKVAFASSSYRTSVDLKDKWRNLLKASSAQGLPNKEINSRKSSGGTPLPEPILLKVRELAELHAQAPGSCSSSKVDKSIGANVRERHLVPL